MLQLQLVLLVELSAAKSNETANKRAERRDSSEGGAMLTSSFWCVLIWRAARLLSLGSQQNVLHHLGPPADPVLFCKCNSPQLRLRGALYGLAVERAHFNARGASPVVRAEKLDEGDT